MVQLLSRCFLFAFLCASALILGGCKAGFGRSGNANLTSITVTGSDGSTREPSPAFAKDVTTYTYNVSLNVTSVTISAKREAEEASMTLNGAALADDEQRVVPLSVGDNTVKIVVTAENELTKTYNLIIERSETNSTDATLSSLQFINATLDSGFSSGDLSYSFTSNAVTGAVRLVPSFDADATSAEVNGEPLQNGVAVEVGLIDLADDPDSDNTIEIHIVAGDETTERRYEFENSASGRDQLVQQSLTGSVASGRFGAAVARDGNWLAVGAPGADGGVGAVYLFTRNDDDSDWAASGGALQSLNLPADAAFGSSVSLHGSTLVVGAPGSGVTNVDAPYTGSVRVFTRNGAVWTETSTAITDSSGVDGDRFGAVVKVDNNTLVVGAPNANAAAGRVYVFEKSGSTWTSVRSYSHGTSNARFGASLGLNDTGYQTEFVAGAPGANRAYVYRKTANAWPGNDEAGETLQPPGEDNDEFGAAVDLLYDRIVVAAPGEDSDLTDVALVSAANSGSSNSGAVYLFNRGSENWTREDFFLKPSEEDRNAELGFGRSLALSVGAIAVGTAGEDSGINTGSLLNAAGRNGDAVDSGGVFIYVVNGALPHGWENIGVFKKTGATAGQLAGSAVALRGQDLVVGADGGGAVSGSVVTAK